MIIQVTPKIHEFTHFCQRRRKDEIHNELQKSNPMDGSGTKNETPLLSRFIPQFRGITIIKLLRAESLIVVLLRSIIMTLSFESR